MVGVGSIVLLIVLIALGIPIAFCLIASAAIGLVILRGWNVAESLIGTTPHTFVAHWTWVVLPLFIVMGNLAFAAGVTTEAYDVCAKWLQRVPGGLALATIGAAAVFGACCGSSIAACAALGKVAIPELRRHNYDIKLILGSIGTSATLAIMIPPSAILVVYGMVTEVSIGQLLLAGFFPGVLQAIVLALGVLLMVRLDPKLAPRVKEGIPWREKIRSLRHLLPVSLLFFIVIGGIYFGVFTPTEAGAFGVAGAALLLLFRSKQKSKDLARGLNEGMETTCMVLLLSVGAILFSQFLTLSGIPRALSNFVVSLEVPRLALLIILLIPYIPLGMFLDPTSIMLLTLPIVFPIVIALGFSGVWFGILITVLIELALITPPVGFNVFVLGNLVPELDLMDIFRPHFPFIGFTLISLAILIAFPDIALFLPNTMFKLR